MTFRLFVNLRGLLNLDESRLYFQFYISDFPQLLCFVGRREWMVVVVEVRMMMMKFIIRIFPYRCELSALHSKDYKVTHIVISSSFL